MVRFKRFCNRCNAFFKPYGKFTIYCDECRKEAAKEANKKRTLKYIKNNEIWKIEK